MTKELTRTAIRKEIRAYLAEKLTQERAQYSRQAAVVAKDERGDAYILDWSNLFLEEADRILAAIKNEPWMGIGAPVRKKSKPEEVWTVDSFPDCPAESDEERVCANKPHVRVTTTARGGLSSSVLEREEFLRDWEALTPSEGYFNECPDCGFQVGDEHTVFAEREEHKATRRALQKLRQQGATETEPKKAPEESIDRTSVLWQASYCSALSGAALGSHFLQDQMGRVRNAMALADMTVREVKKA